MEQRSLEHLTPEEKKLRLFLRQKQLLDTFLQNGAISRAQYEKSFGDLKTKMNITEEMLTGNRT